MPLRPSTTADAPRPGTNRRRFLAVAAGGAAAAAPLVGARAAHAGTNPAYVDAPNTFTSDQRINARLGINVQPEAPLHVVRQDAGVAVRVVTHEMAFAAVHDVDWQGQTHDLVNLYHKSAGDAVFLAHQGGRPPGFNGVVGGMAALNALIPYHLDNTTTGRDGTIVNDRTGTRGLYVELQAVVDGASSIEIGHWSNEYAMRAFVQPPDQGQPTGRGGGMIIGDWSDASTLRLQKRTVPQSGAEAILNMRGQVGAATIDGIHIRDGNDLVQFIVRTDGSMDGGPAFTTAPAGTTAFRSRLAGTDAFPAFQIAADGRNSWGNGGSSATDTTLYRALGNVLQTDGYFVNARYLVAHNGGANRVIIGHNGNGESPGLAFGSTLDTNIYRSAADILKTDDAFHVKGALRHLGGKLGVLNATPVTKPTVTGSRKNNKVLADLLTALAQMGLIVDSSTS